MLFFKSSFLFQTKYISGTLSFTNPNIPPLTSVELRFYLSPFSFFFLEIIIDFPLSSRASLLLGQPLARGGSPGDAIPIQIMPFKIQIAAVFFLFFCFPSFLGFDSVSW